MLGRCAPQDAMLGELNKGKKIKNFENLTNSQNRSATATEALRGAQDTMLGRFAQEKKLKVYNSLQIFKIALPPRRRPFAAQDTVFRPGPCNLLPVMLVVAVVVVGHAFFRP